MQNIKQTKRERFAGRKTKKSGQKDPKFDFP